MATVSDGRMLSVFEDDGVKMTSQTTHEDDIFLILALNIHLFSLEKILFTCFFFLV